MERALWPTWTTCHSARSITYSHTITLQTLLGQHATAPAPSPTATQTRYKHYLDYMPQRPLHHLQPHDHVTNTTWTTCHSARSITYSHTNTLQTLPGLHATSPAPSPTATRTRYKHYLDYMPQRPLHHLQPHEQRYKHYLDYIWYKILHEVTYKRISLQLDIRNTFTKLVLNNNDRFVCGIYRVMELHLKVYGLRQFNW